MMSFQWENMHKFEQYYEASITDDVIDQICKYYDVEDITELTDEEMTEVMEFRRQFSDCMVMQCGFSNAYNEWVMGDDSRECM
jgi:hypothetical protein